MPREVSAGGFGVAEYGLILACYGLVLASCRRTLCLDRRLGADCRLVKGGGGAGTVGRGRLPWARTDLPLSFLIKINSVLPNVPFHGGNSASNRAPRGRESTGALPPASLPPPRTPPAAPLHLTSLTPEQYHALNRPILYAILTQPHHAKAHTKHLHAVVSGYAFFVTLLVHAVDELLEKLVDTAINQLLWVAGVMVNVAAVGFDGLLVSLLRQIVGGDFTDGNLLLCFEMVTVSDQMGVFAGGRAMVLSSGLYVFLRLLGDHCRVSSRSSNLARLEIQFCIKVCKEQFHLCLNIGRDVIRLLQDLIHVPEFRTVWKNLILNPGEFKTSGFSGIAQFYSARTPSRYFLLWIPPMMETHLRFLLTQVTLGDQKRHQAWFAGKYLFSLERETLICDIVRFICCVQHPTKEIIQSDIIPGWAVIGWLLKCCRKNYVEANVKLALFYDWLLFDERALKS